MPKIAQLKKIVKKRGEKIKKQKTRMRIRVTCTQNDSGTHEEQWWPMDLDWDLGRIGWGDGRIIESAWAGGDRGTFAYNEARTAAHTLPPASSPSPPQVLYVICDCDLHQYF